MKRRIAELYWLTQARGDLRYAGFDGVAIRGFQHHQQHVVAELPQVPPGSFAAAVGGRGRQAQNRRIEELLGNSRVHQLGDVGNTIHLNGGDSRGLLGQRGGRHGLAKAAQKAASIQMRLCPHAGRIQRRACSASRHQADHADCAVRSLGAAACFVAPAAFSEFRLRGAAPRDRLAHHLRQCRRDCCGPQLLAVPWTSAGTRPQFRYAAAAGVGKDHAVAPHQQREIG